MHRDRIMNDEERDARDDFLVMGVILLLVLFCLLGCGRGPTAPELSLGQHEDNTPPPSAIIEHHTDPAVCMAPPYNCRAGVSYCDTLRNDHDATRPNYSCTYLGGGR